MYAQFTDDLITGNNTIDTQHRELIEKINGLLRSCEAGDAKVTAIRTLDYLADYTEFHFQAEETLQEEKAYPGIDDHKAQHQEFRDAVKALYEMLQEEEGPTSDFVEAVHKNVVTWLYRHIQGYDRSVAEYIFMTDNNERL